MPKMTQAPGQHSQSRCGHMPCPFCCLGLAHDVDVRTMTQTLTRQLKHWTQSGCSYYQLAVTAAASHWIERQGSELSSTTIFEIRPLHQICSVKPECVLATWKNLRSTLEFSTALCLATSGDLSAVPPPPGLAEQDSGAESSLSRSARGSAWQPSNWRSSGEWCESKWAKEDQGAEWRDSHDVVDGDSMVFPAFQWEHGKGNKKKTWKFFEEPWNSDLLAAYNSGNRWWELDWGTEDNALYIIDFKEMTQKSKQYRTVRRIRYIQCRENLVEDSS